MKPTKQEIADYVNSNCVEAACFMCAEADKYDSYTECPYLALKQIARERKVTVDDIKD